MSNYYKTVFNFRQDLPIWSVLGIGLNKHTLIFLGLGLGIYVIQYIILFIMKVNVFISLIVALPLSLAVIIIGHWPVKKYNNDTLDKVIIEKILYKYECNDYQYIRND